MRPHLFRTHDAGKSWTEIDNGLPAELQPAPSAKTPNARASSTPAPKRRSIVSFDDGDHWQSLRLNMPASSVRDLAGQRTTT